jgi:hypothetical protein
MCFWRCRNSNGHRETEKGQKQPMASTHTTVPPLPQSQQAKLRTVTIHLPLIHNPNALGLRMPIWLGTAWKVVREIQSQFSGLRLSLGLGWCADQDIWDPHLCVDFDVLITSEVESFLFSWQKILQERFRQRSIYMKVSAPARWV